MKTLVTIKLLKSKASLKRRLELQSKILKLLDKYNDVPILVMHLLKIEACIKEGSIIKIPEKHNAVHIINHSVFVNKKLKKKG